MDAPLKFGSKGGAQFELEGLEDSFSIAETIEQLTGFVRRQFPIFAFIIACCIALGLVYLLTTPPSFTSHAMLLIDSSKVRMMQEQQAPLGDIPIDTAQVETQVEILKSENIGLSVIKELKLTEDPEFVKPGGGLWNRLMAAFSSSEVQSETALRRIALGHFLAKRNIARVGRTYVLDLTFTSLHPSRSAEIANAIADAYIIDQLEAKYQVTKRASVWLQDRIRELRKQATDADRAVLDYKEKNKIVSLTGPSAGGGTRLLGEQQLEDLNTQLGSARASAEETKAKLERINEVMQKDVADATVTDSLRSDVINRLRNNYLDMAAKESIWSARYGKDHLAAVNLRTQMAELRRSIRDELGRIAESQRSDYEIAKTRVEGLERELQKLVASSQLTNRDRLGLSDFESTAKVYHSIYDSFLQRYMEAIQQQSFPITEARVISAAAPPDRKSSPLTTLVLGISAIVGIVLSFGAAVFREAIDQVFRSKRQVEQKLHGPCVAVLPLLTDGKLAEKKLTARSGDLLSTIGPAIGPFGAVARQTQDPIQESGVVSTAQLARTRLTRVSLQGSGPPFRHDASVARQIASNQPIYRHVIEQPLSAFAEAFRSIKVSADLAGSRIIAVTSTVPGEGKSTISSNLAQLISHAGKRVILVDADLRNPSLSRALARDAKAGLLEVMNKQIALDDAVFLDEQSGLHFLPSVASSQIVHTNDILGSDAFKNLMEGLREGHDYIIVDLSPIAPVVDVRAAANIFDSYLYVIEWGRTRTNLVEHQVSGFPEIQDRLLGFVLNKAQIHVLERYEAYYGKNYYKGHYGDKYRYSG
jgi:succinoglycan biosynthesis transport protein ExoP